MNQKEKEQHNIAEYNALTETERIGLINYYLDLVLDSNFPYYHFTLDALVEDLTNLQNVKTDKANSGLKIVQHYFPSIYHCNVKNLPTPFEGWNSVEIMRKVIDNRLKYKGKNLTPALLRQGLSISKRAPKVSVFRPALAKYLINKYLDQYNEIFDPCAGFGGRLLGAVANNKHYLGYDINSITVSEANEMIKELSLQNVQITFADSLYKTEKHECLFTCPPYADKEKWHQDIEEFTAEEWIDILLRNYDCNSYLFVVDNPGKYKDNVVEIISNKSHFSNSKEYVILIKKEQ